MRTRPSGLLLFLVLTSIALLSGCQGTGGIRVPATPPTFVMAWTGEDSRVHTMQSKTGSTWVLPAVAPGPNSTAGVAVAHDGTLGWMVMWNSAGGPSYLLGAGGLPSDNASAGISWESTATSLRTTAVDGTPTLAYGNQKWVSVFRAAGGALRVVPSILGSPTTAAADVAAVDGMGTQITDASQPPALAFGAGKFVLAYIDQGHPIPPPPGGHAVGAPTRIPPALVARTSSDGITWSQPSTIFFYTNVGGNPESCISPTSATLGFADGAFYAVGLQTTTRCGGGTQAGGSRIVAYKSSDGASWTTIVNRQSGPAVVRGEAGIPGAVFAQLTATQCPLVVAYTQTRIGPPNVNVPNHLVFQIAQPSSCSNPASFTFGAPQTIRTAPTARLDGVMAVAFGRGPGQ